MIEETNMLTVINDQEIDFKFENDKVFATSLDIANVFGKNHRDVLRTINALPKDNFRERNFALTYRSVEIRGFGRVSKSTRKDPIYHLTRDGFAILAMGFTGEKAYKWKIAFINAFNQMEQMIQERLVLKKYGVKPIKALPDKYDLPATPFRQVIIEHIDELEKEHNIECCGVEEYTITEKYKNGNIIRSKEISVCVANKTPKIGRKKRGGSDK